MYMHYYAPHHRQHRQRDAAADARQTAWKPRVDIREEAGHFVILADLPGIDPRAIAVEMDGNVLRISGERAAAEQGGYSRLERRHGTFRRDFALPENVDGAAIVATGSNGVLELRIPKKPELAPRRIEVGVRALDAEAGQAAVAEQTAGEPGLQ